MIDKACLFGGFLSAFLILVWMVQMRIKNSIECWIYNVELKGFLLLKCPVTVKHGIYWQPVTGGVEPTETHEAACIREVKEETGIEIFQDDLNVVAPFFQVEIPENDMDLRKRIFLVKVRSDAVFLSDEHLGFQWIRPELVSRFLLWDSNRRSFSLVMDYFIKNHFPKV